MGADKVGHVFNDSQDLHTHLAKHEYGLPRILKRDILWRADHYGSHQRHSLRQGELHIPCARRQVHQKVVQLSPINLPHKLSDHAMKHGPPPDQRRIVRCQEAHGHDANAILRKGLYAIVDGLGTSHYPQHHRNIGTVYVGIHQAHRRARLGQGHGQIHRNRALPHAALAASDSDDILHASNRLLLESRGTLWNLGSHVNFHRLDAPHVEDGIPCLLLQILLYGTGGSRELQSETHLSLIDLQVLDKVEGHDIPVQIRVLHGPQGLNDSLLQL